MNDVGPAGQEKATSRTRSRAWHTSPGRKSAVKTISTKEKMSILAKWRAEALFSTEEAQFTGGQNTTRSVMPDRPWTKLTRIGLQRNW
jgi:hypothetical protein